MRIVIFKSQANPNLRAFASDPGGQDLPRQFAPWHAVGVVLPGGSLPHNLDRAVAEKAITSAGYQLWRFKSPEKKKKAAAAG